jgi:hypothetical protein
MSILLQISASDAAVESILRTAAATGLDTESQISFAEGRIAMAGSPNRPVPLCHFGARGPNRRDYVSGGAGSPHHLAILIVAAGAKRW